jgi:hypothetical protein
MPETQIAQAVQLLDLMLEHFLKDRLCRKTRSLEVKGSVYAVNWEMAGVIVNGVAAIFVAGGVFYAADQLNNTRKSYETTTIYKVGVALIKPASWRRSE